MSRRAPYRHLIITVSVMFIALSATRAGAITIDFDYSRDTSDFFGNATAKTALEAAGGFFESRLTDDLDAISPGGGNEWTASFFHPADGSVEEINDMNVAADTLTVFAGARNLSGDTLGSGGPGGFSASGTADWLETVGTRGEGDTDNDDGDPAEDFGPWGGQVAFDTTDSGGSTRNWHFNHNETPTGAENDFYSVALHELGHLLGLGSADSWESLVNEDGEFIGVNAVAEHGGNVALTPAESHWAEGTMSNIFPDGVSQEAAMDPSLTQGARKHFTDLDMAGLEDVGWTIVPEPASLALLAMGGLLLWRRPKRA